MNKTMTNIEMVDAVNALNEFVGKDKVVPVALSVAISANVKTLLRELEPYEEERQKLVKEKSESADSRLKELFGLEVDVTLRTIPLELLEGLELTTKDYISLEFMLEESNGEREQE